MSGQVTIEEETRCTFARLAAVIGAAAFVFAALLELGLACCVSGGAGGSQAAAGCKVGVSWNNFKEERWAKWDEPNIKQVVEAAGGSYVGTDAGSSAEKQATDVEQLITDGAKVIIILAQDGTAIQPTVQAAVDQGIPVIAYDRLIENEKAFYITFDNPLVGELMAKEIVKVVPKGNYVIIKGNSADANSDFLRRVSRRSSVRPSRLAISRSSARTTPTTGMLPSRRPPWSSTSPPRTTRSMRHRAQRRHGRRRRRGAQGPGPRWKGPGHAGRTLTRRP